jgi:flagellar hook protein FlgE
MVDGKEVTGAEDGQLATVVTGKLKFTDQGILDSQEVTEANFNFKGGAFQDQKVKMNFAKRRFIIIFRLVLMLAKKQ